MKINITEKLGSGNWITAGETKPTRTDNGEREFYTAEWRTNGGRAEINSIIVCNSESLACVLVGYRYSGKYRGGSQYYRFYKNGNNWQRVTWKQLDDADRMTILDAVNESHVPGWANIPGKLIRDYIKPGEMRKLEMDEQGTIYAYKYLIYSDGTYRSPRYPEITWYNDELEADAEPTTENSNGIYAAKNRKSNILADYRRDCILVKLALSGTVVEANEGLRAQHAQIVEVLS